MSNGSTRPGSGGGESVQNPVTLREYLEKFIDLRTERFDADFEKVSERFLRVEERFTSMQRAVDKFEEAQRERDMKGNEFRKSLEDQANRSATKDGLESLERNLGARISALEKYQFGVEGRGAGASESRSGMVRVVGVIMTGGFLLIALLQLILHFLPIGKQ